jgi:hypothetical protein
MKSKNKKEERSGEQEIREKEGREGETTGNKEAC